MLPTENRLCLIPGQTFDEVLGTLGSLIEASLERENCEEIENYVQRFLRTSGRS